MFHWQTAKCGAVTVAVAILAVSAFAAGPSEVWLKVNPVASPPAVAAMAMAYDPISKMVLSFGGYDATSYRNDTWLYDGVTWTQITTANAPSPRAAAGITVDQVSGKLILFGGYNGSQ